MKTSASHPRCFERAFSSLSPFHRDVLRSVMDGAEESVDGELARRYRTSLRAIRLARLLARKRLDEALAAGVPTGPFPAVREPTLP